MSSCSVSASPSSFLLLINIYCIPTLSPALSVIVQLAVLVIWLAACQRQTSESITEPCKQISSLRLSAPPSSSTCLSLSSLFPCLHGWLLTVNYILREGKKTIHSFIHEWKKNPPLELQHYIKQDLATPANLCANGMDGCTMLKDAHLGALLSGLSVLRRLLRKEGLTVIVSDACPFLRSTQGLFWDWLSVPQTTCLSAL